MGRGRPATPQETVNMFTVAPGSLGADWKTVNMFTDVHGGHEEAAERLRPSGGCSAAVSGGRP